MQPFDNTEIAHSARAQRRIHILDIPIDDITEDEAVAQIAALIEQGGIHQIATVNPEFIMEAQHNPPFCAVLQNAALCTPDGFGLLLMARWLGAPLRGRVTGVELTLRLAELAAQRGYRIFLLGAMPGIAEETAEMLMARFPGLQIAGCLAGSPHARHEPFLRQVIQAAAPHILLVAYGHPAQYLCIARNQPFLNVPIAIGVGGTYDYLTGHIPRAPRWLRRLGLEWLYRLMRQPKRWKRIYTAVIRFPLAVIRRMRRGSLRSPSLPL